MTYVTPTASESVPPNPFIRRVSWLFLLVSAYAVVICVIMEFELSKIFLKRGAEDFLPEATAPAWMRWEMLHIRGCLNGFLIFSVAAMISSYGLVKGRQWGRQAFTAVLRCVVVWSLFCVVLAYTTHGYIVGVWVDWISAGCALSLAGGCAWLIRRINAPSVVGPKAT